MTHAEKGSTVNPITFSDFSNETVIKPVKKREKQSGKTDERFSPLFSSLDDKASEPASENQKMIAAAQEEARKIIESAKRKANELTEKAYEEAYAEGEKAGYEFGLKKLEGIIQALTSAKQKLEDLHKEIILSQEKEIISLVLRLARKVIKTETQINEKVLSSVIRAALEEVPQKDDLRIRLNPMDYDFIQKDLQSFFKAHEELKGAVLESDSRVDLGSVIVDHKMGSVDARLSRQYEKIEALFLKILKDNLKEKGRVESS